jgi:hypothetical protein
VIEIKEASKAPYSRLNEWSCWNKVQIMQIASGMSPSFAAVPPRYAPNLPLLPSSAKLPVCILSFCRAQRFTYHIELKIATDRFYRKL